MKMKLLFLMTLLFCVVTGFSQNTVSYSTLSKTIDLDSGVEGTVDILVNCYGNSSTPVFLNTMQSCGNNDGIFSQTYTNGSVLSSGQNTTLRYKFKKTVTANTQIVYKFSTNGSCFQAEKDMIKITVNYKAVTTTPPTDPSVPGFVNRIKFFDDDNERIYEQTIKEGSRYTGNGSTNDLWMINVMRKDLPAFNLQWQTKTENGDWTDIPGEVYFMSSFIAFESSKYRLLAKNKKTSYINISNELSIKVIPAPVLLNNVISISGTEIQGSIPTGGINSYDYNWYVYVLEGEDPWLMSEKTKDYNVPNSVYDFMEKGGSAKAYVVRDVKSGRQVLRSNAVVVNRANDIANNTISLSGNNITGSLPTGGDGSFKYEYQLYNEYDGEIIGEVETVGHDQNYQIPRIGGLAIRIFRKVYSGNKVSASNVITILPVGVTAKKAMTSTEIASVDLTVYPNPTSQTVNFATNFSVNKEIEITVYSEGLRDTKPVFKGTVTPNQVVNWNFPSNYPKGLYFYKIMADNKEVKSGKLSLQ